MVARDVAVDLGVTRILDANDRGEPVTADQLLPLVYGELRALAAQWLAQEKVALTLQPTALVHEAYLRLVGNGSPPWNSRGHFFAAAALALRRILVENARRKKASKRGAGSTRVPLEEFHRIEESPQDVLDLDEALARFADEEPAKADLVHLRFFAGLTTAEAAEALGVSPATAERWWNYAKVWPYNELRGDLAASPNP